MNRRLLLLAAIACALAQPIAVLAADALDVTPVTTGWRDAASFKRISEYFTNRENTGDTTVLRTHPDQRAGYYFLLRLDNPAESVEVRISIQLIMPTEPRARTHTFTTRLPVGKTLLNLGLTGSDWSDAQANPVAWKIDFTAPDGRVLASEKSYLWDKPVNP